jgi:hypothetical protein
MKNSAPSFRYHCNRNGTLLTRFRLPVLTVCVAWACSDPTSPNLSAPDQARLNAANTPQEEWVRTPAGLYHTSCVHEIPAQAKVDINRVVHLPSGAQYQVPACTHAAIRSLPTVAGNKKTNSPVLNGWVEWASTNAPYGNSYRHIEADFIPPFHPTTSYSGKTYYTFPGLQNGTYIIQPVLQYGSNGRFGGSYWTFASWHCHDSVDNCFYSTPLIVPDGEALHGDVTASNCAGGLCDWAITSADLTVPAQSVYYITDYDNYTNAVGGSVEVYNLTSCDDFPGGSFFYRISLSDQNGQVASPNWAGYVQGNPNPSCYFRVSFDATSANLWCCHAPGQFAISISGKQYIALHESAQYTATPSNGTPPYTYQWRSRVGPNQSNLGPWGAWQNTGSQNYTYFSVNSCGIAVGQLEAMATDMDGNVGDTTYFIYITNPC